MKRAYFNGNIITMAGEDAGYVLCENGVITETGRGEPPAADEYADLGGRTLMPSFIDTHSHFMSVAYSFLRADLDGAVSIDEIRNRLNDFITENKKRGQWVVAMGYDHNGLKEKRHITSAELEFGDCAVVLENKSGHSGIFNAEAQRLLGIMSSKDGLLEENEYLEKLRLVPMENISDILSACEKAEKKYFSHGITTAQDGYAMGALLDVYKALAALGGTTLDIVAYPDRDSFAGWREAFPESMGKYHNNFKLGGLKIMLDGSPQGKTAWISGKYADGTCAAPSMTEEAVDSAVKWAAERDIQVIAHCNGDMACEMFINAVEKYKNRRAVIIHAQLLRKDQLERVKRLEMIPSFFVAHVFRWGDIHIQNLGLERAKGISPAGSALKEGITFTFHQDSPVIEPDMFETVWCAVRRKTKNGAVLGEKERIGVYDAIKAVTVNAAYQYFEEGKKGIIAPGAFEDFIIADRNPLSLTDNDELKNIKILSTIKRGTKVYEA